MTIPQYTTASITTAILIATGLWIFEFSTAIGMLLLASVLVLSGSVFGSVFKRHMPSLRVPLCFGILTSILLYPVIITPIYWVFGYSTLLTYIATILILGGSTVLAMRGYTPLQLDQLPTMPGLRTLTVRSIPLALMFLLLGVLVSKAHGDTIISPWTLIGPKYMLVTALSFMSALYVLNQKKLPIAYQYTVLAMWYAVMYFVILLTHSYAFGFDQHIHLASMKWISNHGLLEPKVPYYLGQYFLAIPFSEISHLSIDWISRALVPVLTILSLPAVLLQKKHMSPTTFLLLPLVPLGIFTFTTPNNLALVLTAITLFAVWTMRVRDSRLWYIFLALLVGTTLITHVLIGLPLLLSVALLHTNRVWQRTVTFILIIIGVPLLLHTYGGGTTLVFEPQVFLDIFAKPHWYIGNTTSIFWHMLYSYKFFIPIFFVFIATVGAITHRDDRTVQLLLAAAVGTFLSSACIAISIRFPELATYEQSSYATRLLSYTLLLVIPLFLLGVQTIIDIVAKTKVTYLFAVLIIPVMLASYYFIYPTRDAISYYTGVSVRDADIEAIQFVEQDADGEPYIVLTNQTVSVGALSTYGFERYLTVPSGSYEYFYAIPTGGPLYQYFREYIYEGYDRTSIEAAMEFAGVDRAYIIHTNYWAPAAEIRDVSKTVAEEWWGLGDGRVWVYRFSK